MTGTTLERVTNGTPAFVAPPATVPAFNFDESMRLAETLAASGFFSDARGVAQAVTKMLAGRELGIGPIASMTGVNIIKGKVTLSANLMASAIKRHPRYTFTIDRLDDQACELRFWENGEEAGVSTFSMEDATKAGLTGSDMYRKFPRNMLFSRCLSNGAKWYCPDVFGGPVYTPDELGAEVNAEGEVVGPTQPAMPKPLPEPARYTQPTQPTPVEPSTPVPPAPASPNPTPEPEPPAAAKADPLAALRQPVATEPEAEEVTAEAVPETGELSDGAKPDITGDDDARVGPVDAKNITDYLRAVGAGRQFVSWALVDAGVQRVGDPHEALGRLTKAQARAFVDAVAAKFE